MAEPRTGPKQPANFQILSDNQLSNAISAQILPIEPQVQHQSIHRVPVNGSSMIVNFFFSKAGADIAVES